MTEDQIAEKCRELARAVAEDEAGTVATVLSDLLCQAVTDHHRIAEALQEIARRSGTQAAALGHAKHP